MRLSGIGHPFRFHRKDLSGVKIAFAPPGPYSAYSKWDTETEACNIGIQAGTWMPSGNESFVGTDGIPYQLAISVGRQSLLYSEYDRATHDWIPNGLSLDFTYYFDNQVPAGVGTIPPQVGYTNIAYAGPYLNDFATDGDGDPLVISLNGGSLPAGVTLQQVTINIGTPSERTVWTPIGTPTAGSQGVYAPQWRFTDIVGAFLDLAAYSFTVGIGQLMPDVVGQLLATGQATIQSVLTTSPINQQIVASALPAGTILSTLPIAETYVPPGTGVTINVSGVVVPPQPIPTGTTAARGSNWLTANDIIVGALRFINAYAPGESLASEDALDALQTLNDLLESLSTDQASVFASVETILTFTPSKYVYTIGNYPAGLFAGTVISGSNQIINVTPPTDMVVGGDLSGAGIAPGTTVLEIGTNTILMSQLGNASPGPQQIGYTICGDFKTQRPLRVGKSFTRYSTQSSGLDYPIEVVSQDQYTQIGYKGITAPWPICMWYNATVPLGTLYFYQSPSAGGELHLFVDTILTYIQTLDEQMIIPQGYTRMLKRMLARELAPEYGVAWTAQHEKLTMEALNAVKSLNQVPAPVANFDAALPRVRGYSAASWITTGGFWP